MSDIRLETVSYDDATIGRLQCGKLYCFSLELPWRDNEKNVSCIPAGTYNYEKRISPRNGQVIELKGVEGRTFIQIHKGNFTYQIAGCILVGISISYLDSDSIPDVSHSANVLNKLLAAAPDKGTIEVIRHGI